MPRAVVEVRGARELRASLKKAGLSLDDLVQAHRQAGQVAAVAASPPIVSGRLAGTVRSSGTKTAAIIRAGRASVPYAGPIHWGWPRRHIAARPFLTIAAQRTEPEWIKFYEAARDKAIDQVKGI